MKLSQIGEFGLIDLIAKHKTKLPTTVIGIGDDCAVIKIRNPKCFDRLSIPSNVEGAEIPTRYLLITTDTLIENVHFKLKNGRNRDFSRRRDPFFNLGRKALAVNISDIAAMGGYPTHAVVTAGLPSKLTVQQIQRIYKGIDSLAKKHKIDIVGGDTVASPKALIISITLLGEVEKEFLLTRSGAKVGDLICATGKFGGPAARKFQMPNASTSSACRIKEARIIAKSQIATSMIDSSDGLVRSVLEICKASKVGARITEEDIPISKGASLSQALYGGEEYELIFTAAKKNIPKIRSKIKFSIVGEITRLKAGVKLIDRHGRIQPLKSGGYEHFKSIR